MSRIGDPVTPSHAIALIKDLIAGTNHQKNLVNFKRNHCREIEDRELGQVGYTYWLNFKSRNADKIITRRGEQIELNHSDWTTYQNFAQMCNRFGDEMEYAKVTERLDDPR